MSRRHGGVRGAGLSAGAAHYYARIYAPARAGCLAELRRAGCAEEEAEDIFGTTLERIMGKFDPTDSPYAEAQMVALLKKACRQKLIDERRHRGVLRLVPLEDAAGHADTRAESPSALAEMREALAMGREAIDSLPERDRRLFLQRHELRLSPEEILRRNPGLSRRTYRKVIQRANARALAAFGEIESGLRCERMRAEPMRRYVAGEASEKELEEIRLHLRACRSCRAQAAEMRSYLHDVAAGLAFALAVEGAGSGRLGEWLAPAIDAASDRGQAVAEASRHARERLRELGLRIVAGTPGSGGDTVAGQLVGLPAAKAVSVCAGALAVGCLAAGVAPGLDALAPAGHHRSGVSAVRGEQPTRSASAAPRPAAPVASPQSHPAKEDAGEPHASPKKEAPAVHRPQEVRSEAGSAMSPSQQAGAEFGGDAAGAGRPFTPLPSAPPAGNPSSGDGDGSVTRSRSAGTPPESASQGSSEFGF